MLQRYTDPQDTPPSLHFVKDEKELYPVWENLRGCAFQSSSGRVKVIDPGRRNPYSGPDYTNAILEFEHHEIKQGDVEIHVRQQDWELHRHTYNKSYANVILNIILKGEAAPVWLDDVNPVPTAVLGKDILAKVFRPACENAELDPEVINSILRMLARSRYLELSHRFIPGCKTSILQQILHMPLQLLHRLLYSHSHIQQPHQQL